MRAAPTLSVYLGRNFLVSFFSILFVFVGVSFLFDVVEMLRRASSKQDATLGIVLSMSAFKMPHLTEQIIPFAVLLAVDAKPRARDRSRRRCFGLAIYRPRAFPGVSHRGAQGHCAQPRRLGDAVPL